VAINDVQTLDLALFHLSVTSNHGIARAVGYGVSTQGGLTRYGFSISEDAQSGCAVAYTKLAEDVALEDSVFDGFRGRLCFPSTGRNSVEVLDYV